MSDRSIVTTDDRPDTARRGPGRPPRLSHEAILDAARRHHDELTMTAIADHLDVTVAALYRYFPDRDALVGALARDIVASLEVPPATLPWREWLGAYATGLRRLVLDHPVIADTRSWAGLAGSGTEILETGLEVLARAGFDAQTALDAYNLVAYLAWQSAQLTTLQRTTAARPSAEEYRQQLPRPLPPHIDRALPELLAYDLDQAFATHLEWALDGIPDPRPA